MRAHVFFFAYSNWRLRTVNLQSSRTCAPMPPSTELRRYRLRNDLQIRILRHPSSVAEPSAPIFRFSMLALHCTGQSRCENCIDVSRIRNKWVVIITPDRQLAAPLKPADEPAMTFLSLNTSFVERDESKRAFQHHVDRVSEVTHLPTNSSRDTARHM